MITFDLVNRYSSEFLKGTWQERVKSNCNKEIKRARFQGNLLCENIIIYNYPMDMESTSIPYIFDGVNWNKSLNGDPEWIFMLSRHGFMIDLAIAYRLTKDRRYLVKWKDYLFSFITHNGIPLENNKDSWRNIDTGIRLSNWMRSLIYLGRDLVLSTEELKLFEESLKVHLNYLYEDYKPKQLLSNWGVLLVTGILSVSILFPELVDEDHKNWAWNLLSDQIEIQFYKDGIQWEQSPLYHHEVVLSIAYVMMHAEYTNQEMKVNIREKLKPLIYASQFYVRNNNKLLSLHDSDGVDFSYVYSIYRCLGLTSEKVYNNEKGILFVGKKYDKMSNFNYEENENINGCFKQKDSGFLAYKDKKHLITMFNGRHGSGHGHASLGSVTISLNKEDLIGDPGRFTYQQDSVIRSSLKRQWMHNTVDVDNKEGFIINGAWSYDEIQDPISNNYVQDGNYIVLESSWIGKLINKLKNKKDIQGEELYIIKRTVFIQSEMNIVIIFTNIEYPGKHKWRSIYNIEPTAKCINGEKYIMKTNKRNFAADVLYGEKFKHSKSIFSNKYNQLCNNDKLISEEFFTDRGNKVEAFYEYDLLSVRKVNVHQNGSNSSADKDKIIGFEIKINDTNKKFSVYYCAYDTFKGDKLYISENNHSIYGKLTVFDEKNRRIKLL